MRTVGVDLSADTKKTGVCTIDWDVSAVAFLRRPVTDTDVVDAASSADMTALDVPLGWPDAFVEALSAHRNGEAWPPISMTPPADREPLRFRTTDIVVAATGAAPLSVSTQLLGITAMRGARIQQLLGDAGVEVDRSGTTGRVIETYPAAVLRGWGMTSDRYKGPKGLIALRALVEALAQRCGPLADAATAGLDGCDDDDLDALICAVVARAALLGLTAPPAQHQIDIARREGWIHLPTTDIETVVARQP